MRRLHGFCVGASKTGTTSIASLFDKNYRAAHEAELGPLTKALYRRLANRDDCELRHCLLERDRRLGFEMESAGQLGLAVDLLVDLFPDAKFVLTIREPWDWLRSEVNEHLTGKERFIAPNPWRDIRFGPRGMSGLDVSRALEESGAYSVEGYLRHWVRHYELCLRHIPVERKIVIHTGEISDATHLLEIFFSLQSGTLDRSRSRENVAQLLHPLTALLDDERVYELVAENCSALWSRMTTLAASIDRTH